MGLLIHLFLPHAYNIHSCTLHCPQVSCRDSYLNQDLTSKTNVVYPGARTANFANPPLQISPSLYGHHVNQQGFGLALRKSLENWFCRINHVGKAFIQLSNH